MALDFAFLPHNNVSHGQPLPSLWFIVHVENGTFVYKQIDKDFLKENTHAKSAFKSIKRLHYFKKCLNENRYQSFVESIPLKGKQWSFETRLIPVIDETVRIVGFSRATLPETPPASLSKSPDFSLLGNIGNNLEDTIKSLKTSVFLLNKAEQTTTRRYFNELADANLSKMEYLVDDIKLLNTLTQQEKPTTTELFSLDELIQDISLSRQTVLSQKSILLNIARNHKEDITLVANKDCLELLLNKLFDLISRANDGGFLDLSTQIDEGESGSGLLIRFTTINSRKPANMDMVKMVEILKEDHLNRETVKSRALMDLVICKEALRLLQASIAINQPSKTESQLVISIPVKNSP